MRHTTVGMMLAWALLVGGCGGGNATGNAPGNDAARQCAGPDLSTDEGKAAALVERFMQASAAQDQEKCLSMLVKDEREQKDGSTISFNKDGDLVSWRLGAVTKEGEEFIVPVTAEMKDKPEAQTMPMVVLKEDGELRVSLTKTLERYFKAMREKRAANGGG